MEQRNKIKGWKIIKFLRFLFKGKKPEDKRHIEIEKEIPYDIKISKVKVKEIKIK